MTATIETCLSGTNNSRDTNNPISNRPPVGSRPNAVYLRGDYSK